MKCLNMIHVRRIAIDSIISASKTFVSHVILLTQMLIAITIINLGLFIAFAGMIALFFKYQYPAIDLIGLVQAYMGQCTPLNTCSLQSFMQVLQAQLMMQGISLDTFVNNALASASLLMIVQTLLFTWSSLAVIRIALDLQDTSRSRLSRLLSVIKYVPRALASLFFCALAFIPSALLALLGSYSAGIVFGSECSPFANLFLLPAFVYSIVMFIRIRFFPFVLLDYKVSSLKAVIQSFTMTRHFTVCIAIQLTLLWLVRVALSLIPVIGGIVELFILYPIEYLSSAYVYRYIEKKQ